MLGNRAIDTSPEVALRRELHRRGLRFRKHVMPVPGLRCTADLVFPAARVAVFVDGCYWHRCPVHATTPKRNVEFWAAKFARNVARDRLHDRALADAGGRSSASGRTRPSVMPPIASLTRSPSRGADEVAAAAVARSAA
jgi:DNA mismatch endonuclease (patch repair protein)